MTFSEPLTFVPCFRQYLWGGRRLGSVLGKPIGPDGVYAESWELVDHGTDQSIVASGPFQGQSLHQLVKEQGAALLGRHHPQSRFPLLFKFLDSQQDLSIQVHPNDAQAQQQNPPDLGKTEAWVILDAQPGAVIYAGLKRGFDRPAVEREIARGTLPLCVHKFAAQAGDCLFIPAGTVHALGAGFLVAEIQQASDTTFRLYDWDRVGADGRPRPLHIEQGLEVIDYAGGPITPQVPRATHAPHREQLVECDKFVLDRWTCREPQELPHDNRFHFLVVLSGEVQLGDNVAGTTLRKGQTCLIPAVCPVRNITPRNDALLLDIYLP